MPSLTPISLLSLALALQSAAPVEQQPSAESAPPATTQPAAPTSQPDTIRLATWNIENWRDHFESLRLQGTPRPENEEHDQLRFIERFQNEEDNWEIAQVIADPAFSPDVLVFQEGPSQAELDAFRDQWLGDQYETAIVFPGNSGRGQTLGILVKPGFQVIERADGFYERGDPDDLNPRSDHLFARGPAFVLIESPAGYRFWVGTTHQKSKSGNSVEATRWRNAEAAATRQIMKQLRDRGPEDVFLLGDMNDEVGIQEFETEGGGDVIATLVGPAEEGLVLATKDLAEQGAITYTGYWRPRYRSFIDHVVITRQAADQLAAVGIFDTPWARVASDHLPVYIDVRPDAPNGD